MATNSSSLLSVLAKELLHSDRPPPGRQWGTQVDDGIRGVKRKSVYASGENGQLHTLSEMKAKGKKRKADRSKQPHTPIQPTEPWQPQGRAPVSSTTTIPKSNHGGAKNESGDADCVCNVCNARFSRFSKLARHLADPMAHLDAFGLEDEISQMAKTTPTGVSGSSVLLNKTRQTDSRPRFSPHFQSSSQALVVPDRWREPLPKKRSWDEYTVPENQRPLVSQPEALRRSEIAEESKVIDLTSPEKCASTESSRQSWIERSAGRMPNTPTNSQAHPKGNTLSGWPDIETIPSGLNPQLSPPNTQEQPPTEPPLCPEQRKLVQTIMSGRNVFYTGSAGCGKSTVLKNFVRRLKARFVTHFDDQGKPKREPTQVDIIAPTGRAALDINGSTFWTYAGWNPDSMKKPLEKLKDAAEHGKWVRKRLRATDVLVIDEISMMENHHLERLNHVMQSARGNLQPFGGVQLVVTGDFCQLPPVKPFTYCYKCGKALIKSQNETLSTCPDGHGQWEDSEKWAFCSSAWTAADFVHVNLTTIHRQSDKVFIDILQKCRLGVPFTSKEETLLLQHESQTSNAVKLFSTRAEVGSVNREAFNRLKTPQRTYTCFDDFRCYNSSLESKGRRNDHDGSLEALRDHRFDTRIDLKQGMAVVLLVNLDQSMGLVNGSQGVIMGFEKAEPGKMPEAIKKDSKGEYDYSRMGSGPVLTGEHAEIREANIQTFMENSAHKEWPTVLFQNRVTRTIYADCRVNELGDEAPHSLLSRTQIPLVAGWAMTVHKSQGMTLNRVFVNLGRSFEEGQMYVALSRARSLEGLKVEALGKQQGCNARVRQFLREMLGIEGA